MQFCQINKSFRHLRQLKYNMGCMVKGDASGAFDRSLHLEGVVNRNLH